MSHLHSYSPASSSATSTSVLQCSISIPSGWAGLQAVLLLDRGEWNACHHWLLPTSKILLLPWLQGELPKCLGVSSGADGTVGTTWCCAAKKKKSPSSPPPPSLMEGAVSLLHPNHSVLMTANEPTWLLSAHERG